MTYKTIVVHVDDSSHANRRAHLAANIAVAQDAHLIGVACTGISRYLYQSSLIGTTDPWLAPLIDTLQKNGETHLQQFDDTANSAGVLSFEKQLVDDDMAGALILRGRYADLVIIGQNDPDEPLASLESGIAEYVVMNGGCPTMVIPYAGTSTVVGSRILIAWNGSRESTSAVRGAIPLLKVATVVELVVFNPAASRNPHGRQAGHDIALYLARHQIKVDVITETVEGDVGEAILSLADNLGSDLIVMGSYGHTSFREMMLGGVTRTMFSAMTIPVLTSH